MMQKLYNILLAVSAIALFGHSLVQGQPVMEKRSAVLSPAEEKSTHSTHPLAQPNLFNVFHPAESGISISNIPAPWLSGEEREQAAVHKFIISAEKSRSTVYLQLYESVNRAARVQKLIFPFHTFL